jgi:choline dehydrogenase-like flavoprotein
MNVKTEIIIVGAGPAGISAAIPLVSAGIKVIMLDAGKELNQNPSQLAAERQDKIGGEFQAIRNLGDYSPKFRVPWIADMFSCYSEEYALVSENFLTQGMLAPGGLSNAWGAGVACYDANDLKKSPINFNELKLSYQNLAKRIGISGEYNDDLSDFFGHDIPLQTPTELDPLTKKLLSGYTKKRISINQQGFYLGKARNAVLTTKLGGRNGCTYCGMCLFGCVNQSIYNAAYDLKWLLTQPSFRYIPNVFVKEIETSSEYNSVKGINTNTRENIQFTSDKILLACGAIGTAKLVLNALNLHSYRIPLLSSPTVAFAALLPSRLGQTGSEQYFGLAQLSFYIRNASQVSSTDNDYAFGNIFTAQGLPTSDFISRTPLSRPIARKLMKLIQPSIVVANCFLPGALSKHSLSIDKDNNIHLSGNYEPALLDWITLLKHRITKVFRQCGAIMLPGSFMQSLPGSDLHYAGTVPHQDSPKPYQTFSNGLVAGLENVYVVDGAALTNLPAKPHTFTIMANADRIARALVQCSVN